MNISDKHLMNLGLVNFSRYGKTQKSVEIYTRCGDVENFQVYVSLKSFAGNGGGYGMPPSLPLIKV